MGQDQTEDRRLWLTLQAACEAVSLSESTLRRLIKAGKFRSKKCGKRRLVDAKSMFDYFENLPS